MLTFFLIKPTDKLISHIYFVRNSTFFGQFLCPSSGVFHCKIGTFIACYRRFDPLCLPKNKAVLQYPLCLVGTTRYVFQYISVICRWSINSYYPSWHHQLQVCAKMTRSCVQLHAVHVRCIMNLYTQSNIWQCAGYGVNYKHACWFVPK